MNRRSKREIERVLADLEQANRSVVSTGGPELSDRYSSDAVTLIYRVCRDLFRICHRHSETVVNAPDDEGLWPYLEYVREEYEIHTDRDDAVHQALMTSAAGRPHWTPIDTFAVAAIAIAKKRDVVDDDGISLQELVDDGLERDAEKLLVSKVYDLSAGEGGRSVEVTA